MFESAKPTLHTCTLSALLLTGLPLCVVAAPLTGTLAGERTAGHGAHAAAALPSPRVAVMNAERQVLRLEGDHHVASFRTPGARVLLTNAAVTEPETRVAFPIHWQNLPLPVSPEVVHVVKHFRHEGLPVLRLWQSGRNLLHVGLNGHGTPGIWFVQRSPD